MAVPKRTRSDQHQDHTHPENADTSSNFKRPRGIGSEAQQEPVQRSSPSQVDEVVQDSDIPPRRYATRKSTQVGRPAKAAGLAKRTKAEVSFAAAAKKEQKAAKAPRVTETKARVAKGVATLARLQQERLAADNTEENDLRTARRVQDNESIAQQAASATSRRQVSRPPSGNRLPRGLYSASSDSGDDLGDALNRIRLKPVSRTVPSVANRHNSDPARDGELRDDFEADELAEDPEANELEYDPEAEDENSSQLVNEFAGPEADEFEANEPEDDPEADELEDDPEADELEDDPEADESGLEEGDEDGDGDDAEPGAAAQSRLSRSEKRIQKRKEMRERIASHGGPQLQGKAPAKSTHLVEVPRATTRKKGKNSPETVFRSDWKARVLERQQPKSAPSNTPAMHGLASKSVVEPLRPSTTPARASQSARAPSRPSSTPSRATRPSQTPPRPSQIPGGTSGWKAVLRPPPSVGRSRNAAGGGSASDGEDAAEPNALRFGAFTDADVSSTREYALAAEGLRRKSKLVVERVEESEDDGNGAGARAPIRKRPRRAPSEIPEQESRSSRNLPSFIKPFLTTRIIPTVIDYYGAKANPWDLQELGRDELLDLCQVLVDEVAPRVGHDVKKSEPIYKLTQQAVYAWRSHFAQAAVSAIQEAIVSKFGLKPKMREVKLWVAAAVMSGGEAMWARPKTQAARAEGKLQSKYVLKTFASHLTATTGSLHDYGYPGGALAIAAAAVKHVFPMFESGVFIAATAFSGTNIEDDTSDWYTKTVSKFVRTPDHFKILLRQAAKFATATKVRKVNPRDREVSVEFSRSSPPLEDHELDMV